MTIAFIAIVLALFLGLAVHSINLRSVTRNRKR